MSGSPLIVDDLAGHRAVEGLHHREVGLQEAPFGLGVVGEGAAGRIAEAGGLALVERDILLGSQVEAEIVGILAGDDLAGLGGERRRHQAKRREGQEPKDHEPRALPYCSLKTAAVSREMSQPSPACHSRETGAACPRFAHHPRHAMSPARGMIRQRRCTADDGCSPAISDTSIVAPLRALQNFIPILVLQVSFKEMAEQRPRVSGGVGVGRGVSRLLLAALLFCRRRWFVLPSQRHRDLRHQAVRDPRTTRPRTSPIR